MARIKTTRNDAGLSVLVTGRLTAFDMGRLEYACAPALVAPWLRLHIDVSGVTYTDPIASAILQRMVERGAVLREGSAARLDRRAPPPRAG
jgi:hypothetical protein